MDYSLPDLPNQPLKLGFPLGPEKLVSTIVSSIVGFGAVVHIWVVLGLLYAKIIHLWGSFGLCLLPVLGLCVEVTILATIGLIRLLSLSRETIQSRILNM
jgi:hypothetical protein